VTMTPGRWNPAPEPTGRPKSTWTMSPAFNGWRGPARATCRAQRRTPPKRPDPLATPVRRRPSSRRSRGDAEPREQRRVTRTYSRRVPPPASGVVSLLMADSDRGRRTCHTFSLQPWRHRPMGVSGSGQGRAFSTGRNYGDGHPEFSFYVVRKVEMEPARDASGQGEDNDLIELSALQHLGNRLGWIGMPYYAVNACA
jgi:hypothetical protein